MKEAALVATVKERLNQAGREVDVRWEAFGISIYSREGTPIARLRCLGESGWEVRRPARTSWTYIGEFGGEAYEELDEAISYIVDDPMGVLW